MESGLSDGACLPADCQSVLVGSSSLALWNIAEQKRVAKFMGHSVSDAPHNVMAPIYNLHPSIILAVLL